MAAGGHFGCPKITIDHISGHCTSIQDFFVKFCTKWPPALILDVQNSLLIVFLANSDQYTTFIFFEIFDKMAAILNVRNSLTMAFLAISDRYSTLIFFDFFLAAIFDCISGHF